MSTLAMYRTRIRRSLRGCRFKPALSLNLFEEGYCLDLLGFLIALPFMDRFARAPKDMMERWGVYYFESAIWFCWGNTYKAFYMPWMYSHVKWTVMRPDGTWVKRVQSYEAGEPDGRWQETYPYHYRLRNGQVQERNATIYVERGEWRQRWLKWCPLFAKVRTNIDITFDDEVGEQSGSWKGGCIGTGYDMKPGETPLETLRRMERERTF